MCELLVSWSKAVIHGRASIWMFGWLTQHSHWPWVKVNSSSLRRARHTGHETGSTAPTPAKQTHYQRKNDYLRGVTNTKQTTSDRKQTVEWGQGLWILIRRGRTFLFSNTGTHFFNPIHPLPLPPTSVISKNSLCLLIIRVNSYIQCCEHGFLLFLCISHTKLFQKLNKNLR